MAMMTMSGVRTYLSEHHRVSLTDIATHFDSSPEAVRQVLDHWEAKGKVRRLMADSAGCCGKSGSSCSCSHKPEEIYEWLS